MSDRIASVIVGSWEPDGFTPERQAEDIRRVQLGLAAALQLAETNDWNTVWVVTITADDLRLSRTINAAFGEGMVQSLLANRPSTLQRKSIRHATLRTLANQVRGAVLALYPNQKLLDQLDALYTPNAVVVVPYVNDIQLWIDTWGPTDLITKERRPHLQITDPEVFTAVTDMVTHMRAVSHASDKKSAQQVFAKLRRRKRNVDPREIRAYVTRETGWGVIQADDLAKIAAGRKRASGIPPA
jgi:hypothetical protein